MADVPRVTVLMPVYNGERYLSDAIYSILEQTFTDFEFVIIDDGSTDTTWEILSGCMDSRIRPIRNGENIGLIRSLNKGLSMARGEYVARMDADDISLPERLATQVAFLDKHPNVGMVTGNVTVMDGQGRIIRYLKRDCHPDLVRWYELFYHHATGHSQWMFRADVVRELGGYNETIPYVEDYELCSRIAQRAHIVVLSEALVRWRRHEPSISSVHHEEQLKNTHMIACRNLEELMGTDWARQEVCLEMIDFWAGQFSLCKQPVRLWCNLAQVRSAFVRQRDLMSSSQEFDKMLRKAKARQMLHLANYWLRQRRRLQAAIGGVLAVIASPLESLRMMKRKLTRRVSEPA